MALFDTYRLADAVEEARNLAQLRYPLPAKWGSVNSVLNPLGPAPARGFLLIRRKDLDLIDQNTTHTLEWEDGEGHTRTHRNLYFVKSQCITPGDPGDENGVHLMEVADYRHLLADPALGVACNKQYNVRAPAWSQNATEANRYYADTLNSGSLWTWQTLVTDLWNLMPGLGSLSTLPWTPDGTPEGWKFPGVNAWEALTEVLVRIGCAVKWDDTASSNAYSIVRVGATDSTTSTAIDQLFRDSLLLHDDEWVEGAKARIPGKVRVYFHVQYLDYGAEQTTQRTTAQWSTAAVHQETITGSDANADSNIIHGIWDDLPALANADGTISNSSALATRAQERADDFYRMISSDGGGRLRKTYHGIVNAVTPGSTIKGVIYRQDMLGLCDEQPGGLVTEVYRHPYLFLTVDQATGQFTAVPYQSSSHNRPPAFGPGYPNYPHLLQVVELTTSVADVNGLFTATVQQYDPVARTFSDKEACYVRDANRGTQLTSGRRYHGRLSGHDPAGGAPIYTISTTSPGFWAQITTVSAPAGLPPAFGFTQLTQALSGIWSSGTIAGAVADSTLGVSLGTGDTTVHPGSQKGFPTSGSFAITIDSEDMLVTAGWTGGSWTVIRGINGTTAATHSAGAAILYRDGPAYDANHFAKGVPPAWGGASMPTPGTVVWMSSATAQTTPASSATPSSTDTSSNYVTFGSAHGWPTGTLVSSGATVGGLTAGQTYYIRALSSTTAAFYTSLADALADSSRVDLTANITQTLTPVERGLPYYTFYWVETPITAKIVTASGAGAGTLQADITSSDTTMEASSVSSAFPPNTGFYVQIDNEVIRVSDVTGGASTTLASAISNSATSLSVAGTVGFVGGTGYARIGKTEIVKITAGASGTSWTVTRAQNGSTASGHGQGAEVLPLTHWTIERAQQQTTAASHTASTAVTQVSPGYSWSEQVESGGGQWTGGTLSGTLASSPALERNDNFEVPVGAYVQLWRGFHDPAIGREWIFDYCCEDCGGVVGVAATTYTVRTDDECKVVTFSNSLDVAVTLPQASASTFHRKWYADFQNRGSSTVTITPTTSTIDGASSLTLLPGQGVTIYSDATNYYTQRGKHPSAVNAQTGTTYTVLRGDHGKLVTYSNSSAVAVTLPQASSTGFGAGWYSWHQNIGSSTVTITPTTSTIDGASALTLFPGQGVLVMSNGTNYSTERGRQPGVPTAKTANYTLTVADYGGLVVFNSSSNLVLSVPQATSTGFGSGWRCSVANRGSGTLTLTPTTSTIDGFSSTQLGQLQGVDLWSDGTNYFTVGWDNRSGGSNTALDRPMEFRLTLSASDPAPVADQSAATTLYMLPYKGNRIALYNGTSWRVYTASSATADLSAAGTDQMYDVFCYASGTTPTLELLAWTNDTTRATALTTQDGRYVKTGDATRLYIGSLRTVSNNCDDTKQKRLLWNYYNRIFHTSMRFDTTDSWTDSGNGTWSAMNGGNAAWKYEWVVGVVEDTTNARAHCTVNQGFNFAICLDGTTIDRTTTTIAGHDVSGKISQVAEYSNSGSGGGGPVAGYHYLQVVETSYSLSAATAYGDNGASVGSGTLGVNSGLLVQGWK